MAQIAATVATSAPLRGEGKSLFTVRPAPGPEEVNWGALWMTWRGRELRKSLVTPLLLLVVLVPVSIFAGGLQQLNAAACPLLQCTFTYKVRVSPYKERLGAVVAWSSQHIECVEIFDWRDLIPKECHGLHGRFVS
jgi:hypothetical protein